MTYNKKSIGDYEIGELLHIQVCENIIPCLIIDIQFSRSMKGNDEKIVMIDDIGNWFWPRQDFLTRHDHKIIPHYSKKNLGNCWQLLIGDKKAWLAFN